MALIGFEASVIAYSSDSLVLDGEQFVGKCLQGDSQ